MKIFYAGAEIAKCKQPDFYPPIGVLISFYKLKKLYRPAFTDCLFLDSGAYSAWRQNIKIDLDSYIKFIYENKSIIDIYASLDDITSAKISKDNFISMKRAGLNPLPAFHYGEERSALEFYIKHTDYIGLGGVAIKKNRHRIGWASKCFADYPGVKFHGFGIGRDDMLMRFPWHSVDSSGVHTYARYGGIWTPWGAYKINPKIAFKYSHETILDWRDPSSYKIIRKWVKSKGIDFDACKQADTQGTMLRCLVSILHLEELCKKEVIIAKEQESPRGFGFY